MTPQEIIGRLSGVRKTETGWLALCPAHDDSKPSLSVGIGTKGQVLVKCFAGCPTEAIVEALRLRMADLFPRPVRLNTQASAGVKK